ncbi:synaptonemal complex central element protein 2-like [Sycon ciliatum]|uniref:synaptonemal complex central element protein 2-like n=1 Tax=Sycon ciliatum TaxID=27933 RepID=UPI0031F6F213
MEGTCSAPNEGEMVSHIPTDVEREGRGPTHANKPTKDDAFTSDKDSVRGDLNTDMSMTSSGQSRADPLKQAAQQLIESINKKRQHDATIVADLRRSLEEDMNESYIRVQQGLSEVYDKTSHGIQEKLEEVFATLDRIVKLEMELQQVSKALGTLYADMQGQA